MDILRTSRLSLRTWREDDIDAFVRVTADPAVHDFLPGPWTHEKTSALAAAQNAQFERLGSCYFAATLCDSGALIGFVGLKYQDADLPFAPCFELGWCLGTGYWGQGYASDGARACLAHGFDTLGLQEIISFTVPANLRSRAVMERLGLRHHPEDDFDHPALAPGHRLSRHVLYRIARPARA